MLYELSLRFSRSENEKRLQLVRQQWFSDKTNRKKYVTQRITIIHDSTKVIGIVIMLFELQPDFNKINNDKTFLCTVNATCDHMIYVNSYIHI